MSEMNDIAKRATVDKLLSALKREGLPKQEAAKILCLRPDQMSFLSKEKNWPKLTPKVWDTVRDWVNSGWRLREYPEHRRPVFKDIPPPNTNQIAPTVPKKEHSHFDEVMEIMSRPKEKKEVAGYDFVMENSILIVTVEGKRYRYIPFWLEEEARGEFTLHSLDKLPEDLLAAIKLMRGE